MKNTTKKSLLKQTFTALAITIPLFAINFNLSVDKSTLKSTNNQTIYNDNKIDTVINYNVPEQTDENHLLNKAFKLHEAGLYEAAFSIYIDEHLTANPTALCNLGYMYANGIGCDLDFLKAYDNFTQAIELGSQQALQNLISMFIKYHFSNDVISFYINKGIEENNSHVLQFLKAKMPQADITPITEEDVNQFYTWITVGIKEYDDPPADTENTYYELVGAYYPDDDAKRSLPVFQFKTYERTCTDLSELLDEKMIGSF